MDTQLVTTIRSFIAGLEYQLWGVRWQQQGKTRCLQVFIDHDKGIGIDDCVLVSRDLSALLDVELSISGDYVLEVSSPGLDRLLFDIEQFRLYIGQQVVLRLYRAIDSRKKMTATIVDCQSDYIVVSEGDRCWDIPVTEIKEARLKPKL